jgi:hypothetical protein
MSWHLLHCSESWYDFYVRINTRCDDRRPVKQQQHGIFAKSLASSRNLNSQGNIHGGALATWADVATSLSIWLVSDVSTVSVGIHVVGEYLSKYVEISMLTLNARVVSSCSNVIKCRFNGIVCTSLGAEHRPPRGCLGVVTPSCCISIRRSCVTQAPTIKMRTKAILFSSRSIRLRTGSQFNNTTKTQQHQINTPNRSNTKS